MPRQWPTTALPGRGRRILVAVTESFDGKAARSAGEIQHTLKEIHFAVPELIPGDVTDGTSSGWITPLVSMVLAFHVLVACHEIPHYREHAAVGYQLDCLHLPVMALAMAPPCDTPTR